MQTTSLAMSGVTRFSAPMSIDLSTVGPGVTAVVGPNGAGKTSILECMCPAPLWLSMPTRPGALADNCTDRKSRIEMECHHGGHDFLSLIQVDIGATATSKPKVEAWLRKDGVPINNGKAKTYHEQVALYFPPEHLVLASAFAAQGGQGSFSTLDIHKRRSLFRTMLGLDELQALSRRSGKHRLPLDGHLRAIDQEDERLRADEEKAQGIRSEIQILQDDGAKLSADLDALVAARDKAVAEHTTEAALLGQLTDAQDHAIDTQQRLSDRMLSTVAQLQHLEAERTKTDVLLRDAEAIRNAAEMADTLTRDKAHHAEEWREANAELGRLSREETAQAAESQRLSAEIERLAKDIAGLDAARDSLEDLKQAADLLDNKRAERPQVVEKRAEAVAAHRKTEDANRERRATAVRYVEAARRDLDAARKQAAHLDEVPCEGGTLVEDGIRDVDCGKCPMLKDAMLAQESLLSLIENVKDCQTEDAAAQAEAHGVADLQAIATDAGKALADLDEELQGLWGADARHQTAVDLVARSTEMQAQHNEALHHSQDLDDQLRARVAAVTLASTNRQRSETAGKNVAASIADLGHTSARLAELHAAEGRAPVLAQAIEGHHKDLKQTEADIVALVIPPDPEEHAEKVDLLRLDSVARTFDAKGGQERLDTHRASLARLNGSLETLGNLEARRSTLDSRRERISIRRSGFALLEHGFGPEAIQALEFDAAGPGVSALTNDLLGTVNAPYTAELCTIRESGKGRKQKEVFDIVVHDGRSGTSRELGRMSGGEAVIIEEALKLAIAVHVAQRANTGMRTIWRDECDGALSVENANAYPAMLRSALALGGFDRCYFITHRPSVAVQADTIVYVGADGQATVMDPGDYAAMVRK